MPVSEEVLVLSVSRATRLKADRLARAVERAVRRLIDESPIDPVARWRDLVVLADTASFALEAYKYAPDSDVGRVALARAIAALSAMRPF
jgi:hypothetical protein